MDLYYLLDYFLFTLLSSFGVLQLALSKSFTPRYNLGLAVLLLSYLWFFAGKDRNVPTIVEGTQLFLLFGVAAVAAVLLTKISSTLLKKK